MIKIISSTKVIHQFKSQAAQLRAALTPPLILFALSLNIASNPLAAAEGYPLVNNLIGTFGDVTNTIRSEIDRVVEESGIEAAATQAQETLQGLAEGAVPVIDDIAQPYHDRAEKQIADALTKIQLSTNILKQVTSVGARNAIDFLQNSPLFEGADFGITTLSGRLRIRVQGTEVSLCRTIVGPLGSVIVTGISNAEKLCNFPDERMSNPTKSLVSFTYMAAGHTSLRVSNVIVPNLAEDLTLLPAPIEASTYIKTRGDQYVQIRLAGADPAALTLDAKFEVGLKANVSYAVDVEVEGEAALKITGLKPRVAAEVILSTSAAMLTKSLALGLDMDAANLTSDSADILNAGIEHLSDIEDQYEDGFGNISLDVKLTGGIGVGFLDTAISAISANSTFNLTAPLVAFIEMEARLLKQFLDVGTGMANANLNLGTSILAGNTDTLSGYKEDVHLIVTEFTDGVLAELLKSSTKITSIKSTFVIAAFGDADKESTVIYEAGLKLPVGTISANIQTIPNALSKSMEAASYLLLAALNPNAQIGDDTWSELESVIVEGIEFTLRARNPITFSLFGFKDADLLHTIKAIANIRSVLIGMINSSLSESLNDVRTAIDTVVTRAFAESDDVVIAWLNNASIEKSRDFGLNGSLGAEAVVELGIKLELKGEVSGSLFLLLLDLPIYQKPVDPENPAKEGLLASASLPIDLSLDAGASAGEGVELTVDAGGKVSFNAFELTVKHWDDDLPTAALLEVAGFPVIEFDGETKQDGSFSGSGFLMLPMGGIASADFSVDQFGNVVTGRWSGGLELGPLGEFPFITGTINNDGLHGNIEIDFFSSSVNANFILHASGLLLGSYDGTIIIADHELAAASLVLGADGRFDGRYQGDIPLGGFSTNSDLTFNNDGFAGSSSLKLFNSELSSTDVVISRSGAVSGTFTGTIVAGSHTLTAVSLRAVNGGLIGTAMMDLPGVAGAEVELRIYDGNVAAFYQGDLFNHFISQASFAISGSGVIMSANFTTTEFPGISGSVIDLVLGGESLAQAGLQRAEVDLTQAKRGVAGLEQEIDDVSVQLSANLEAAQQALIQAIISADDAQDALNTVIAQIDALNNSYKSSLTEAQYAVTIANKAFVDADDLIRYYARQIRNLDSWYDNLSFVDKAYYLLYYNSKRAQHIASRAAAIVTRDAAQLTLNAEQLALKVLNSDIAELLNPLTLTREGFQATYDKAEEERILAIKNLAKFETDIVADTVLQPLYLALEAAQKTLTASQALVDKLEGTIAFASHVANNGREGAFTVQSTNVTADLSVLKSSPTLEIVARIVYRNEQGRITALFNPADPVDSFHQAVIALQTGSSTFATNDVIAPVVNVNRPAEWIADTTLIRLFATDTAGGSGIASITFTATGAQAIFPTTIAGAEAFVLIDLEGKSSLSYFATDRANNNSAETTIEVSIDSGGPNIHIARSGTNENVYEVVITADDPRSGIEYIAVSAKGVEPFSERIGFVDEVVIALTQAGTTTLEIVAMDVAGNITTLEHKVVVPDSPDSTFVDDAPVTASNSGGGGGGGSLDIVTLLLATLLLLAGRLNLIIRLSVGQPRRF